MTSGIYERTPEMNAANSKRQKGVPKSPETCATMSVSHTGVPLSPEHIAALVNGQEESGMFDKMRGGQDIVWHHTLYDHADLSKNRVAMTRSNHTMGHHVLQILGIEIPHINMET